VAAPMAKEANVETRINRILDQTRRTPKAFGRRGWVALTVLAAPLIYVAAAIQLAPAQTPAAPVAPPPPAATVPQMPALPELPAQPQPRVTQPYLKWQEQDKLDQKAAELDRALRAREMALQEMQSALVQAQQAQSQSDSARTIADREAMLAEAQRQLAMLREAMQAQLAQAQTPPPAPAPPPTPSIPEAFIPTGTLAPVHVDVKTARVTVISFPLDSTQQYDVIGRILTPGGTHVMDFRDVADYRQTFEKNVALKDGKYVLRILLRTRDGKMTTQEMSFEVQ
jgi:hypothetical protein